MTDYERKVLEHYQLSTPYPMEWPAEKDTSDVSDAEENAPADIAPNKAMRRSQSKYSALERVTSTRGSLVPGSQKTGNGIENLVQRDEPDPLGSTESVVRILRTLGLPIQDDTRLRKFLLSSTTFSPSLFLSQVHADASTQELLQGLDVLSRSIDQKSASLKVLVESNFERFVRAKQTIDNVYTEMKYRGQEPPQSRARHHSRHASKGSFRNISGNQAGMGTPAFDDKKKNALMKESEYGVLGIKTPLLELSAKAEEVWGPALGGQEKEDSLKAMSTTVERYKDFYEVNASITDAIKRKDYDTVVEEHAKAKRFADDARKLSEDLGSTHPTDSQIHKMLLAARMWHDVEEQIETFKRELWRRLVSMQTLPTGTEGAITGPQDQHMEIIGILLELGVTDNPIWVWLLSRFDYLKSKIQATSHRARVEIEILRRRLATAEKPTPQIVASYLRSLGRHTVDDKPASVDAAGIVELWEKILAYLSSMLSSQGILGEVLDFWQTVRSFVEGKAQKNLPVGLNGESQQHHRLSDQGTLDLQKGAVDLVDMIRADMFSFFVEPPIEDISSLFSPIPPTPKTPKTPGTNQLTPTALRGFALDLNNLPPPSPKRGEAWEKFAFWPPWSNSLSGVYYLAKLLVLVGSGASEMGAVALGHGDDAAIIRLRTLVGETRERCVTAICAAWNRDAENIKALEDWRRSPEKRDLTRMPSYFGSFESSVLTGMQKILYIAEAQSSAAEVVLPPPTKLLVMVRSQFVTTLYKALSGMVENAEKAVKKEDDDWTMDRDGLASPVAMVIANSIGAGVVNASDRNVRMLLTLSNLQALRSDVVPKLTTQFENAFSVKLTDETKTIRDVLGQIDARLFQSYTRPAVATLQRIIRNGISDASWPPAPNEKSKEVRPYVYEALLSLVLVHTQVSTTASTLTSQVLSYLLEQTSRELLEAFKQRQSYTLASLMQATLDVEFVAQTLSQYTTDRASEMQSQIYQELDKGTDNDARTKLQSELPEMRAVLKRLREGSRSEFACFKKIRSRAERGAPVVAAPT